jgi:hypothetical protein
LSAATLLYASDRKINAFELPSPQFWLKGADGSSGIADNAGRALGQSEALRLGSIRSSTSWHVTPALAQMT